MSKKITISIKNKLAIGALLVSFVFSLNYGNVSAQNSGTVPSAPIAAPTGLPTAIGYPTGDQTVANNTSLIVKNTYSIASILTGAAPGAQQDKVKANIGMIVIKRVLRELTKSTVKWINSGFKDANGETGNPSFITDTQQWLTNTADITIGDYLMNDPSLDFLCDPFKIRIKLGLGLQYRPFKEQIKCSFTEALGNVTDAYNKFINGYSNFDWTSWLKMTTIPQNNEMGAMVLSQIELDERLRRNAKLAELEANWGNGFLSWKQCEKTVGATTTTSYSYNTTISATSTNQIRNDGTYVAATAGPSNTTCSIQTPGSAIASVIPYFSTENIRQAEVAQDLNEIANALMNQILAQGMEMFKGSGLLGAGKTTNSSASTNYNNYLTDLERQEMANNGVSLSQDGTNFINNGGGGGTTGNSAAKNQALAKIATQVNIEQSYQQNINNVLNILYNNSNSAFKAFEAKKLCNNLIPANVLNRITGTTTWETDSGNRFTANIKLNKPALEKLLADSFNNINNSLKTLADNISNTNADDASINNAINNGINLNPNMHTAADVSDFSVSNTSPTSSYNLIRGWLILMKNNYAGTTACNADLSAWGIN